MENYAICNLRCPLCSTTWRSFGNGQQTQLSLEGFQKVFSELKQSVFRLTFYMEGEPLVNSNVFSMIRHATSHASIFTSLSSNFTLMRPRRVVELLNSGLDFISISLDGYTQETYKRYRVGGQVSRVLWAIRETLRQRRIRGQRKPFIEVNMIRFKYIDEAEQDQL